MHRHFTLKQFRYFLAVAELGSVAAAARMVNIAQSALTKSILELESTMGMPLFERTPRGMRLTQDGYRFQASARKVISSVAEAGDIGRGRQEQLTGQLTIGVTSLVAGYYLAQLLARFQRSHASVSVAVVEDSPQFLEHLLVNGELDLAIMVANALGDPQALVVELLTSSPNRVWLASSHALASLAEPSLAQCAQYRHVVLEADRIEGVLRPVWTRHGLRPQITLRTSSLEAVRSLVGVGAGITVLPDFLYRPWTLDADHIEARSLRESVPNIDIGLVWRRGSRVREVVSEFIELAREQSRARSSR
ncbi:MAG: LysR family transcriptional regulator [Variovorax sp.]|nr:MAG: LysR family transcriptional regulator [Variovorax sp.]